MSTERSIRATAEAVEAGMIARTDVDLLLAVVEAAKVQHNKWDGYCAKYGRNCPTCIALDALEAAP